MMLPCVECAECGMRMIPLSRWWHPIKEIETSIGIRFGLSSCYKLTLYQNVCLFICVAGKDSTRFFSLVRIVARKASDISIKKNVGQIFDERRQMDR